jgi:D-lyxose ketol-isomerase
MTTPAHTHARKKEDIICRWGELNVLLWPDSRLAKGHRLKVKVSGRMSEVPSGEVITLLAGGRVTLEPGVYHEFYPASAECIIGEVSTANDDVNDNFFADKDVGRYPELEEDEPAALRLVSDKS